VSSRSKNDKKTDAKKRLLIIMALEKLAFLMKHRMFNNFTSNQQVMIWLYST